MICNKLLLEPTSFCFNQTHFDRVSFNMWKEFILKKVIRIKLLTVSVPAWESDMIKPNGPDECLSKFYHLF